MVCGKWELRCFICIVRIKGKNAIKGKARGESDHLTPSIVHISLCMCMCLCNLISSFIVLQYHNDNCMSYINSQPKLNL